MQNLQPTLKSNSALGFHLADADNGWNACVTLHLGCAYAMVSVPNLTNASLIEMQDNRFIDRLSEHGLNNAMNDIRKWMRLVEGDTPPELEQEARMVQSDNQDEMAADFTWHLDPAFPLSHINAPGADWMRDEIKMMQAEYGHDRYADTFMFRLHTLVCTHA